MTAATVKGDGGMLKTIVRVISIVVLLFLLYVALGIAWAVI